MKVIAHLQGEKITKIQWLNFGPQYSKVRGVQILPFREYFTHLGLTVTLKAHAVPSSEPISIQSMESQDITHQPPTDWVAITTWPAHVLFLCLFVWNFSSHSRTFYTYLLNFSFGMQPKRISIYIWPKMFLCLFVWNFSSHSIFFIWRRHRLQILTYVRYLWPLSSKGFFVCHTYSNTEHPFIMVIFEDPWHLYLLPGVWQWSCHYLFLRHWSVAAGIRNPNLRLRGERSR